MCMRGLPIPARLFVALPLVGLVLQTGPARGEPVTASTATRPAGEHSLVSTSEPLRAVYVVPRSSSARSDAVAPAQPQSTDVRESAQQPVGDQDRRLLIEPVLPPGGPVDIVGYYRSRARLPRHQREWADYRYFGGQPSRYGYGMYRRYSDAGGYGYGYGSEGEFFRFGFLKGYDRGQFDRTTNERAQRVLAHANAQIDRGLALFKQGDYYAAADAFQLATETDHGDAASRIYAGHTLFAIGRYRDGVRFLRRAFQLQPRITYLSYDIRDDYGDPADFDRQLEALREALALAPSDPDRLFMLGYVLYYAGQRGEAYSTLAQVVRANPKDEIASRLMRNAQPPDIHRSE